MIASTLGVLLVAGVATPPSPLGQTFVSAAVADDDVPDENVPDVPDLPIPTTTDPVDPADTSSALPQDLASVPADADVTLDADTAWTPVPGTDISVKADDDTVVAQDADVPAGARVTVRRAPSSSAPSEVSAADGVDGLNVRVATPAEVADNIAVLSFAANAQPTDPGTPTPTSTAGSDPSSPSEPASSATDPGGEPSPTSSGSSMPTEVPSSTSTDSASPEPSPSASSSSTQPADPSTAGAEVGGLDVRFDYSQFAQAFGGAWGDRLQVTAFPDCYLTTPDDPDCAQGTPLSVHNDTANDSLRFTTLPPESTPAGDPSFSGEPLAKARTSAARSLAASSMSTTSTTTTGGTVYAMSAASGSFASEPLSPAGSWQVGKGSGEFSWSYDMAFPDVARTGAPDLGLAYSSGSVDAMSLAENGQSSQVGTGWAEMSPGSITRSFAACSKDGNPYKGDFCWKTDHGLVQALTISLNGRNTTLVQKGSTNDFRLKDDPTWRVERVTGTSSGVNNSDDNDEAFKVTTTDGTVYWFGWGNGSQSTNTVPVYGNDSGEPCYNAAHPEDGWCQQAWQWNLDRVVDRSGNVTTYTYDRQTNYYARWANTSSAYRTQYDRNSVLTGVTYGNSHGSVEVTSVPRCVPYANRDANASCSGDTGPRAQPDIWPDTPGDLICDSGSCDNMTPAFFSTTMYDSVVSKTVAGDGTTRVVDRWYLDHTFPDYTGPGDDHDLWLNAIRRVSGNGDSTINVPAVNFNGIKLQNRVNPPTGDRPLYKWRIASIRNEAGGLISVTYGHDDGMACDDAYVTGLDRWNSQRECFAQKYAPPGGTPKWEWFNKYVVTRLVLGDKALGYETPSSTPISGLIMGQLRVYDYEYHGAPGWRYMNLPNSPDDEETWNDWRGYNETVIHTRNTDQGQVQPGDAAQERVVMYRGLNLARKTGNSTDPYTDLHIDTAEWGANSNEPLDQPWYQGRVAEDAVLKGNGDLISRVYHDYAAWTTAIDPAGPNARVTEETFTKTYVGTGSAQKIHKVFATYDPGAPDSDGVYQGIHVGTPVTVEDQAFGGSDIRCTTTSWLYDADKWIRVPSVTATYASSCSSAADGNLKAKSRAYYDNQEDNGTHDLTRGLPTQTSTWTDLNSSNNISVKTRYDAMGRPYWVKDARGNVTTTKYNNVDEQTDPVADGLITQFETTNPLGMSSTTELDPRRGQPISITDPNGRTTTADRDGLGRVISVRLPGNNTSGTPSVTYTYSDSATEPSRVKQQILRNVSPETTDTSYTWSDGWGRPIQTQRAQVATAGARVASVTGYDDQGLAHLFMPNVPSSTDFGALANPDPATATTHYTVADYDAAGRPTSLRDMTAGSAWATTATAYDGNTATVTRPGGNSQVYTESDAWGQPKLIRQLDTSGSTDSGEYAAYTYTAAGQLATITAPIGNADASGGHPEVTWTYTYDLAGRRIKSNDPDTGITTYAYNFNGDLTSVDDATTKPPVGTTYDALDRPIHSWAGSSAIADWTYDSGNVSDANGRLVSSTSHTPLGDFTTAVTGYDNRGEPKGTKWTYPTALLDPDPNLPATDSRTETYVYDEEGNLTSTVYPQGGGLAAITVASSYKAYGLPSSETTNLGPTTSGPKGTLTLAAYSYNNLNQLTAANSVGNLQLPSGYSGTPQFGLNRSYSIDNVHSRISNVKAVSRGTTWTDAAGVAQSSANVTRLALGYSYDLRGNPTKVIDTIPTTSSDDNNQATVSAATCYTYDGLDRLTHAGAGGNSAGCSYTTTAADVLGDTYQLDFNYSGHQGLHSVTNTNGVKVTYEHADSSYRPKALGLSSTSVNDPALPATGTIEYGPASAGRAATWAPSGGDVPTAYAYDSSGNLEESETLTFDSNQHESDGTRVTNAYDANGMRVARQVTTFKDGAIDYRDVTLFQGDTELTASFDSTGKRYGGGVNGVRSLTSPMGTPLATQHDGNAWTLELADMQGSIRLGYTKPDLTSRTVTYHNYYPFGGSTSQGTTQVPGAWLARRAYLDKSLDVGGTLRLDHRFYVPSLNVLTTPDPLIDPADPANLNPYAYSRENPIGSADPSGLMVDNTDEPEGRGDPVMLEIQPTVSSAPTGIAAVGQLAVNFGSGMAEGMKAAVTSPARYGRGLGRAMAGDWHILHGGVTGNQAELQMGDRMRISGSEEALSADGDFAAGAVTADGAGAVVRGLTRRILAASEGDGFWATRLQGMKSERGSIQLPGGRPLSPNQMNKAISRGQAPSGLVRVDRGRVPGEQTHIHLDDGSALNIDGTWKHGGTVLTNAQAEWLEANGWVLPR